MITLITGVPGAGKTLYAVYKHVVGELEKQSGNKGGSFDYLVGEEIISDDLSIAQDVKTQTVRKVYRSIDVERPIYTDINGLMVENVKRIPNDNYDFNQFPEGSIIIYDECQQRDSFKASRTRPDHIVESLQTHRHKAYDIIFITQSPRFVNKYVLDNVGKHIHFQNKARGKGSVGRVWSEAQTNPSSEAAKKISENTINFFFPKRLFGLYRSTVKNTHKLEVPWKKLLPFGVGIVFLAVSGYRLLNDDFFNFGNKDKESETSAEVSQNAAQTPSDVSTVDNPMMQPIEPVSKPDRYSYELNRVAMTVQIDNICYAKNKYGQRLNIPNSECLLYSNNASYFQPTFDTLNGSVSEDNSEPQNETKEKEI